MPDTINPVQWVGHPRLDYKIISYYPHWRIWVMQINFVLGLNFTCK